MEQPATAPPTPAAAGSDSAPTTVAAAATAATPGVGMGGEGEGLVAAAAATTKAGEKDGGDAGDEQEEEIAVYITVHPPRQPATAAGGGGGAAAAAAAAVAPLVLEPLAGVELVMHVRQLLGEIPQTCLYTAFRLVAVIPEGNEGGEGGEGAGGGEDVWKGKGEVMNDFVELRSIAAVVARPQRVEVRVASIRTQYRYVLVWVLVGCFVLGVPGCIPEYDQNNQVWHRGTPEFSIGMYVGYYTLGIPGYIPEHDQNNHF